MRSEPSTNEIWPAADGDFTASALDYTESEISHAQPAISAPGWPDSPSAEAFAGIAGEFVKIIEPETESDPVALLIQFLVFFGNCAGRTSFFQVEASQHGANMNAVLVGDTASGRKGTSENHVRRLFGLADSDWAGVRIQSGLSSGEGLIYAVRDPITKKEAIKAKGRIVDHQDVMVDSGVDDKRLLVIESEFSSVLKVASRAGNLLTGVVRQAWDSGKLRMMTKNSPSSATDAHISILGHIPKYELLRLIDETDAANGFANRFLWLCVRRSKLLPEGGCIADDQLEPVVRGIQAALDFSRRHGELKRDDAARQLWAEVYPQLSLRRPGLLGSVLGRAEAQVVRLSLVYALLDCSPYINEAHLRSALALWKYCADSAAHIFGEALGDPVADTILTALRAAPDGMTRTDISALFGRHRSSREIDLALASLSTQNLTRTERQSTGGRPVEKFYVVELATNREKGELQ